MGQTQVASLDLLDGSGKKRLSDDSNTPRACQTQVASLDLLDGSGKKRLSDDSNKRVYLTVAALRVHPETLHCNCLIDFSQTLDQHIPGIFYIIGPIRLKIELRLV